MPRRQAENIRSLRAECFYLLVGATAVGTGLGAAPGYQEAFYKHLSVQLGEDVKSTADLFDGMQNDDFCVKVSAAVKQAACGISKIAKDLRIMSSRSESWVRRNYSALSFSGIFHHARKDQPDPP